MIREEPGAALSVDRVQPSNFEKAMLARTAESYLNDAMGALEHGRAERRKALDAMPVPVYLADPDGVVTYWNRACVEFAGREPQLGRDRWCVTWEIHTTSDELLPHDECPMAVAIKEKRTIRGEVAIAMRPDGSRKAFIPYPTPLFDHDGEMIGAINLLVDVSDEQASELAEQAARCRRIANALCDRATSDMLRTMADGFERNSAALFATA